MKPMEMLKPLQTYFDLMTFNGAAYVFQVAKGMGILDAIMASGGGKVSLIAQKAGTQETPCRLVLDCLAGMDLLEVRDGAYYPTSVMRMLSGPYSQLGKEYWDHLPMFVKTAQPITRMDDPQLSEKEYIRQVESLDWMMKPSALMASRLLGVGTQSKGLKILDLGAGSGVWSLQMLQEDPTATCTLVDWPGVLQVARAKATAAAINDRVTYIAGNYHEVDFEGTDYDMVILGNVTHIETEEGLSDLLLRSSKALKTNGKLVIFDVFPTQEKGKLATPLYALGLALRTQSGQIYSFDQLKTACLANCFIDVKFTALEITPYTMGMVTARHLEN
ncbi:MAG: class I SAM-dependent methyltransferase [Pseudobdellovibrionaceae bacterium]